MQSKMTRFVGWDDLKQILPSITPPPTPSSIHPDVGYNMVARFFFFSFSVQYGIKKKEEKEAEAAAAMEQASEGSLTRPKKAVPTGCGDEEEEESIVDTVMKFIPTPLMDMFNKK